MKCRYPQYLSSAHATPDLHRALNGTTKHWRKWAKIWILGRTPYEQRGWGIKSRAGTASSPSDLQAKAARRYSKVVLPKIRAKTVSRNNRLVPVAVGLPRDCAMAHIRKAELRPVQTVQTGRIMRFVRRLLKAAGSGFCWPPLLAAVAVLAPHVAMGEYRLRPGDILDVTISGIPDFRQHVPIGVEGEIGLPLAGQVKVGDLSLAGAREKIAAEMANKPYRQYTNEGREILHLIVAREVVVTVGEYSPIFVDGDVAKPGAYGFRPGMTVRQAIAVAGGLDLTHARTADPVLQMADLQTEYQAVWLEIAGEQARM
jgi:protein involved in polysaccharide export with SLBB domain